MKRTKKTSKRSRFLLIIFLVFFFFLLMVWGVNYFTTQQMKKLGLENSQIKTLFEKNLSNTQKIKPSELQEFFYGQSLYDVFSAQKRLKNLLQEKGLLKNKGLEEVSYKEFTTQDGKLTINYPSDWIEIKKQELDKISSQKEERYHTKIIFSALSVEISGYAQIIVEGVLNSTKTLDQIIEETKKYNEEQGLKTEIVNFRTQKNEAVFEGKYTNRGYSFHSKEKIIFLNQEGQKTIYSVAFITFEENWEDYKDQAEFVINSIKTNN